jgi:hypothetical protein
LVEELIAVSINNYFSPLTAGAVKLTASTNYWEVVSRHSVIVLVPILLIVGLLVQKYKWSQFKTFIIFGIIGTLAESTINGLFGFLSFGL